MNFLQGKNGMERASFDAVWPHLPCLLRLKNLFQAYFFLKFTLFECH